ncbi:hypothetical protein SBA4_3710003 [Candidatus Sulfopaludibacter sp. SbA4]|nr:hypothetical protein SBA4_3710003 [Candidatus Sulfopaludibacter sp. SbA4]
MPRCSIRNTVSTGGPPSIGARTTLFIFGLFRRWSGREASAFSNPTVNGGYGMHPLAAGGLALPRSGPGLLGHIYGSGVTRQLGAEPRIFRITRRPRRGLGRAPSKAESRVKLLPH